MAHEFVEVDGDERPSIRAWSERWRGRRHAYPHLAAMPVFAGCTRRQIWRIARWGDVIAVQQGDVLAREDRSNHWFFVVLAGSVRITHRKRPVATLHRGGHFGEVAVIGFRPQPATVTVASSSVLFVLSRRLFVSLAAMDHSIQRALFPDVAPDDYRSFVREMHEEGRAEWERLKPELTQERRRTAGSVRPLPVGRRLSWNDAVESLTRHDQARVWPYPVPNAAQTAPALSKRSSFIAAIVLALVGVLVGARYHPPIAVLKAAKPIDVTNDITITGTKVDKPTGSYILTAVSVTRPNTFGIVADWARGRKLVSVRSDPAAQGDIETERRLARTAFLSSHRQAVALAEETLNVDPRGLTIVIRDRGIGGPSAGLIYALAIIDMLDPADLADGRVIAATGELTPKGAVEPVGFVALKLEVAERGGADLFLVPAGQPDIATETTVDVLSVTSLKDAVKALRSRSSGG